MNTKPQIKSFKLIAYNFVRLCIYYLHTTCDMERKCTAHPSLNPSIMHASKSSPSVTLLRQTTATSAGTATQASGKKGGAHRRYKTRNIVANPDRPTMQRKPYLILEKGVNYTPRAMYDPAYPSASEKAFAGLPAAKPLQAAPRQPGQRSTLHELASSRSSMHSIMSVPSRFSIQRHSRASVAMSIVSGGLASLSEISWMSMQSDGDPGSEVGSGERAPSMFRLREDPPHKQAEVMTEFTVNITESETMFTLNLPTQSEPIESEESKTIAEANADYERVIGSNRAISQTATQTTSVFQKHRKLYAPRGSRKNNTAWATVWDIYDTYEQVKKDSVASALTAAEEGKVGNDALVTKEEENYDVEFEYQGHKLDSRFLNALMLMERLLVKDSFSEKQLLFQGLLMEDPLSLNVKYNYTLTTLWTFANFKTAHRRVTSMCWSPHNGNVLAVGYGKFKYTDKTNGLVCVWNVKNPKDPERTYEFDDPVTFVAFSETRGQILAVSFYSGLVLLIDIISRAPLIKASNYTYPLYHPVWQARWFPVDDDTQGQYLVTCGRNGRIYRYRKTKFFISKKLMTVSRPHGSIQGVEQPRKCYARKTLSTRSPSAEVLVLHPTDPLLYLVGTSEGCVYFCSANHRHDHMDVFVAHNGPVYNIQFNPFCPKVFLTCGADWCIRVWAETVFEPLATLESGMNAVQCALWNPLLSTVIVSGTGSRLEVWDLRRRTSAPKSSAETPGGAGAHVTALQFTANRHNLCVGDSDGHVHVIAPTEMPFSPSFQEEILVQAIDQMLMTRPSALARLRKLGPPFEPPDSASLQARMYRRLNRLHGDIE